MPEEDNKPDEKWKDKFNSIFGSPDQQKRRGKSLPPKTNFSIWYFLIAFFIFALLQNYYLSPKVETIPYSKFKDYLAQGKVNNLTIGPENIAGKVSEGNKQTDFTTVRVDDPDLVKELDQKKVNYTGLYPSKFLGSILSWMIPIAIMFLIWRVAMKRMGAGVGVMSFSKSKAKLFAENETKVTFDDVAGIDEAKEELQEVVEFLKKPGKVPEARGEDSQRGPAGRAPGNGQDPAGQGRGRRGQGSLLQHQRIGVRGDVRRGRRRPGARPLLPGDQPCSLHHLHRRTGCPGQGPGDQCHGRT